MIRNTVIYAFFNTHDREGIWKGDLERVPDIGETVSIIGEKGPFKVTHIHTALGMRKHNDYVHQEGIDFVEITIENVEVET